MGACQTRKLHRNSISARFPRRSSSSRMDFTCQRLSLYLELVGDIHSLGGYLRDRIHQLQTIQHKLQVVQDEIEKMLLLHEAGEIIEYLYNDKHFSQAFPILRESLYEITQMTLITE